MDCYLHPGTASTASCVACARPICQECREDVAGHAMCRACVTAAAARLSEEPATPSPAIETAAKHPVEATGYVSAVAVEGPGAVSARPDGTSAAPKELARPGMVRRIVRGASWGVIYGQWWTLWSTVSLFMWGQGSFDSNMVWFVVDRALVNGFFGFLAGIIIGAVNASISTGTGIGVGAGIAVCLLRVALNQNPLMLVNVFFYFFTGRFVGAAITWRVQQPVRRKLVAEGG